jgi:hypothetical protein
MTEVLYIGVTLAVAFNHWMHTRMSGMRRSVEIEAFLRHCEYLRSQDRLGR